MTRSPEAYQAQLLALLPTGRAWPREPDTVLARLLLGQADELARIDARAEALLEEADPRTASELLPDWERVAGLPDGCTQIAATTPERRVAAAGRIGDRGGQSLAYFTQLALSYGVAVRIEEGRSGDCGMECGERLAGDGWRHVWFVHVANPFGLGLTCVFERAAPAHTHVHFEVD